MKKVMKEKTGLGIAMVLAILMLGSVAEAVFSGAGSGTEEDPYIITNVYQLQEMDDDLDAWYELGNDIDASATETWNEDPNNPGIYFGFVPIGLDSAFQGHFNGKGFTISHLYINRPNTNYIGLFSLVGLTYSPYHIVCIRNVGLIDVDITGQDQVGALAGANLGQYVEISECYSTGNVEGGSSVGGLIGFITHGYNNTTNCYSSADVNGDIAVGGFAGEWGVYAYILKCYSTGEIYGNTSVGGFLGHAQGLVGGCYDCFWDVNTSGQTTSAAGTGKTTAEMKQEATFTNWDFVNIWDIDEGVTYPFLREVGWNPPRKPEAQMVVLDWENDVPVRIVLVEIFGTTISIVDHGGSMPAATGLSSEYRTNTLQRVQQIFIDSGIDNVVITDTLVGGATFVYFTDRMGDLMGKAYTGIDRFNRRSDDGTVVFAFANAEIDAETVAHEVGHTLGLRHVDPDITADPYNVSVMDPDYVPDVNPRFINELSDITDFLSPYNHNPVYHLKRYVDGVPHDDLVAQGIYQGTWDMQPLELIETVLDFGSSDRVLYDVSLLIGAGDDSMMTIANFDAITLSELSELEFTVENGDLLQLVASSTLGGDLDTLLAIGDPNEEANLLVQPVVGQFNVYLQTESDSGPGYVTIAEPNVSGTIFDPNSDFDRDGDIDIVDLSIFVSNWLELHCGHLNCWCEGTDLNCNGSIDFIDFAIFAENWPGSGGQGGGMGGSSSQQMEQPLDMQPVQQVQPVEVQPVQEIDIDEMVRLLSEIWLQDDGIREVISEDRWNEFIDSVKNL